MTIQKITTGGLTIHTKNGLPLLAKCNVTGKFVSCANAQHALNNMHTNQHVLRHAKAIAYMERDRLMFDLADLQTFLSRISNCVVIGSTAYRKYNAECERLQQNVACLEWSVK